MTLEEVKSQMIAFLNIHRTDKEAVRAPIGKLPTGEYYWFATQTGTGPKIVQCYIKRPSPNTRPIYLATLQEDGDGYLFKGNKLSEILG